jgi:CHAD domain-containing protein
MRQTSSSETLLRSRFAAFTRHLDAARAGEPEAVHQARVATRRLRASLPLVTSGARRQKLEHRVRRLTRALGPLRELDVALAMLAELHRAGQISDAALAVLQQSVAEDRRGVLANVLRRIEPSKIEKLRKKTVAAARHDEERGGPGAPAYASAARLRAARRAERLGAVVERASAMYLPDRLHDIRIATKKLRYTLEVLQPSGRGSKRSLRTRAGQIALLKQVQDLLGRIHDLEVLIARTRAVQSAPSAPDLRVSGDLDALVRRLETECRTLHGHYLAIRPQLLQVCARVAASAVRSSNRASAA